MTTMLAATLLQQISAADGFRFGEVLQTITAGGMLAGAGFLWKVAQRLTSIETALNHPEVGAMPAITSLRKSRHIDAGVLQAHETRLDGHDRDISRIDDHLTREPHGERRLNATGEPYDRRKS